MNTSEQPGSIAVIGGGPVGCELAYLIAVLGTQVTVIQRNARLIPREEPEASASMAERLTDVGVRVLLGQQVASAQRIGAGARLTLVGGDPVDADRVVLAVGRRPRTAGLGLEAPVTAHADVVHPFPTYSEILEGPLWRLAAQLSG